MSPLLVVFIFFIAAVNGQIIIGKGEDIVCDISENRCTIDCTDSNCDNIQIYSSSNNTLINCHSQSSCTNINVFCIGNANKCLLSCSYSSCLNSTLTCNTNANHAICECEGDGCPPTSITTNNGNSKTNINFASNDNNYSVDQSLLVVFFSGFFVIILCCFCVLVVALCFIGLYFGEKKKQKHMDQELKKLSELKTNPSTRKISFLSSEPIDIKSEARGSYLSWRSHHNKSYETDGSVMLSEDEKDEVMPQPQPQPQTNCHTEQTLVDIPEINDDETETETHSDNKEESQTHTEVQHEGFSKTKPLSLSVSNQKHQKFDSEDLYILPPQSTNIGLKMAHNENTHMATDCDDDKMDDIGSDNECIREMDGDQFQTEPINVSHTDSHYTLDGHNSLKPVPRSVSIENGLEFDDISVDISAKLPSSPNVKLDGVSHGLKPHKTTKHPPKGVLLRPPTIKGEGKNNFQIEINNQKKEEKLKTEMEKFDSPKISISRLVDYDENNLNPLPDAASIGSESTFTIKSAPQSLSRTTSLNSAAAVRVAFPETNNILNNKTHNIPFGVYHMNKNKSKHRNYYSQQLYFKPNAIRFDANNMNKSGNNMETPPNSNRTQSSLNIAAEKPVIINNISSKVPSINVPPLPNSPYTDTDFYEQQDIVPPLLHQQQLSDDSAVRSRKKKKKAASERKVRSKSRSTRQSNASRKNSNDSDPNSKSPKKYRKRSSPKARSPPSKKKRKNEIIIKQKRKTRRNQRQTVPSYGNNDEAMARTVKIKRNSKNVVLPIANVAFPKSSKSAAVPKLAIDIPDGLNSKWNAPKRIMTPPPEIHRHKYKKDTFHTAATVMSSQSLFIRNIIK